MPSLPKRNKEEVILDILESIALEETAISHIINAEGEKIQKLLECKFPNPESFEQVLEFQKSISVLFDKLIYKQNILADKMNMVTKFKHSGSNECKCKND